MTALQELATLQRQFPRATELAVSIELLERFLGELAHIDRFITTTKLPRAWSPVEHFPGLTIQRLPLVFQASRLSLVQDVA